MPSEKYMQIYNGYWPKASQKIYDLLKKNFDKSYSVCEIGMASGHLLMNLALEGYDVSGYEIRKDEFEKTQRKFHMNGVKARLYNQDINVSEEKFDAVYTTGLLQCLNHVERERIIRKLVELAPMAIVVVPEILVERCDGVTEEVGVAGCKEYLTTSLGYELSKNFTRVQCGYWSAEELKLQDKFMYFICTNLNGA